MHIVWEWGDINFKNKSLTVRRTVQRIRCVDETEGKKTKLIVSTPKTETSRRIIPIPNFLITILKQFRLKNNYYILSSNENLYDPRLLAYFYTRMLATTKIDYQKFHTLRHTFATRCIESKVDAKTLSDILGHSSVETTLKLYVHPSYELKQKSIERYVNYMHGNKKKH